MAPFFRQISRVMSESVQNVEVRGQQENTEQPCGSARLKRKRGLDGNSAVPVIVLDEDEEEEKQSDAKHLRALLVLQNSSVGVAFSTYNPPLPHTKTELNSERKLMEDMLESHWQGFTGK